jgi:cell division protein FtsW
MTFSLRDWIRDNLKGDRYIWWIVLFLSIISILVVYSATGTKAFKEAGGNTETFLLRHGLLVILGLVATFFAHRINYIYFARLAQYGLWLSIPLLIWARVSGTINDASRWIRIPIINQSFQPSDLAKLALISSLAAMLARRQKYMSDPAMLTNMIVWIGVICALIVLTNTSTAVLLGMTCFLLMYIGRVPTKYLVYMVAFCVLLGGLAALTAGQRVETAMHRIETYKMALFGVNNDDKLDAEAKKSLFQLHQSYIAVANGGILGKGPGRSYQRNVLPHPYSDFIFAIIVEEYGLVGGLFILGAYILLLARGIRVIRRGSRPFGGLLAAGLTFTVVLQALISMAVSVGLVPVTGLPLPLLSMGGTSLLFTGLAIGIILSVSREEADESKI